MRQLLPDPATPARPGDADVFDVFGWDAGPGVRLFMVSAADGSVVDRDGWTSGLGGPGDKALIRAQRAMADAILVGAGSVRTGRYPPHRPAGRYAEWRAAHGRAAAAPLVVVSGSAELDWSLPAFTEAVAPTMVLTSAAAAPRVPQDAPVQLLVAGERTVDLGAGLAELRRRHGLGRVLCEGGPTLGAALVAGGLLDELHLTLAPRLAGGRLHSVAPGLPRPVELELRAVLERAGELYLRYRVRAAQKSAQGMDSSSGSDGWSGASTSAT